MMRLRAALDTAAALNVSTVATHAGLPVEVQSALYVPVLLTILYSMLARSSPVETTCPVKDAPWVIVAAEPRPRTPTINSSACTVVPVVPLVSGLPVPVAGVSTWSSGEAAIPLNSIITIWPVEVPLKFQVTVFAPLDPEIV